MLHKELDWLLEREGCEWFEKMLQMKTRNVAWQAAEIRFEASDFQIWMESTRAGSKKAARTNPTEKKSFNRSHNDDNDDDSSNKRTKDVLIISRSELGKPLRWSFCKLDLSSP